MTPKKMLTAAIIGILILPVLMTMILFSIKFEITVLTFYFSFVFGVIMSGSIIFISDAFKKIEKENC